MTQLVEQFDYFLIDQFGVLLDGNCAYPHSLDMLKHMSLMKKNIVILSNSGKRSSVNEERLARFGYERTWYDRVITSGELASTLLIEMQSNPQREQLVVYYLSQDSDRSVISGKSIRITEDLSEANLIIIASSNTDLYSLSDYRHLLRGPVENGIPSWCINPDYIKLTGERTLFSAGSIARVYEEMGGIVTWIGKPHPHIYKLALKCLGSPCPERVLCIGDSIDHDIIGGTRIGCKTALTRTGIQKGDSLAEIEKKCAAVATYPDFVVTEFGL